MLCSDVAFGLLAYFAIHSISRSPFGDGRRPVDTIMHKGHNMRASNNSTEGPVPPKVSKAISETATPDAEPITATRVLHVPDSQYSLEEIHSIF